MAWFNVDDSFYDHPKVWDAPDCAVSLWARAGSWSSRNLTDGFVPTGMPARFCGDPETAVRELLDRGLWQRTKGGYLFHDWTDWNSSKEAVKAKRQPTRAARPCSATRAQGGRQRARPGHGRYCGTLVRGRRQVAYERHLRPHRPGRREHLRQPRHLVPVLQFPQGRAHAVRGRNEGA